MFLIGQSLPPLGGVLHTDDDHAARNALSCDRLMAAPTLWPVPKPGVAWHHRRGLGREGKAMTDASRHIAVIGAGIIGATTALTLVRQGHRVTILDPGTPGGVQSASHGNGAFLSPASIIPVALPGLWKKVPGFLLDRNGPLTIRPGSLPRLAPWLWRFVRAGATWPRVERTAAALADLLADAPARHAALAQSVGRPDLIRRSGLIYAYHDRAQFAAEAAVWAIRARHGVRMEELSGPDLKDRAPGLSPAYRFGILLTDGAHCRSPGAYVGALINGAVAAGAELRQARVTGFDCAGGRLAGLKTDAGPLPCDAAVIASGARSATLARQVGDRIPLESERGYHVEVTTDALLTEIPVMPQDGKMANTPTLSGFRASGQVELATTDAAPDWRRADILLRALQVTWPALAEPGVIQGVTRWQGNRPSTPDGRPVIGRASGCPDVIHAFGHGHIGLVSAPRTAAAVADLISGQGGDLDLAPFAPTRFRR